MITSRGTIPRYRLLDEAIRILITFDVPHLAKTDIANAFRLIPIRPAACAVLGFRCRGASYVDKSLPLGCASSSQTFQSFSDALVWIAPRKLGAGPIVSVLDDFLFIGQTRDACQRSLDSFQVCKILRVPLRPDKMIAPCRDPTPLVPRKFWG